MNVWIDLNNDERYDEPETRVPDQWSLHSYIPLGISDFEISIPTINELSRRKGSHRIRFIAKPNEEYRRKCGNIDYRETQEYTINIVPKTSTYGGSTYA